MLRSLAMALLLMPSAALASNPSTQTAPAKSARQGIVADTTGSIIPGADIQLLDANGTVGATITSPVLRHLQIHSENPDSRSGPDPALGVRHEFLRVATAESTFATSWNKASSPVPLNRRSPASRMVASGTLVRGTY
jgi:hypothetical protein